MNSKYSFLVFFLAHLWVSPVLGETEILKGSSNHFYLDDKPRNSFQVKLYPSESDLRQGGEDINTALLIPALPFTDSGTTCGYSVDNVESCPYFSQGPDVVYTFTPDSDVVVTVDMCGSNYDTFIWIWDEQLHSVACNDDYFYNNDPCGEYSSKIEQATLQQGMTYFIFVAGYAGCGEYQMTITEYEPCVLGCSGVFEGEPALHDGYVDDFNSGCYGPNGAFQSLSGNSSGELEFCGKGGWYLGPGGEVTKDTDWLMVTVGSTGIVEWVLESEQATLGFLLQVGDCDNLFPALERIDVNPCNQPRVTIQGAPGDVLWLWVGAHRPIPPSGFMGHEFNYICTFTGLASGSVSIETLPWCGIKSRFR